MAGATIDDVAEVGEDGADRDAAGLPGIESCPGVPGIGTRSRDRGVTHEQRGRL